MSEKKAENWWERLSPNRIDRRILFWIITILIITIYLRPIGIPVAQTERVGNAYAVINNLPPKSIVLLSLDTTWGAYREVGPSAIAIFKHMIARDLRVVVAGFTIIDVNTFMFDMFSKVGVPTETYKYGVNYLTFGFIPGKDIAQAQAAIDLRTLLKTDFYGTNLDDLPLGRELKNANSFSLVVDIDTTGGLDPFVRYWATPYKIKIIHAGSAGSEVADAPYYPQLVQGIVPGNLGGAEYEVRTGYLGDGVKSTDMLSGTHLLIIGLIIFGNVLYITKERSKK